MSERMATRATHATTMRRVAATMRQDAGHPARPSPNLTAMRVSFWRLQLLGWAAFWLAMSFSRVGRFPLIYMMASKLVMALIGLAVTGWMLRPFLRHLDKASLARTIMGAAIASYVAAGFWTALHGFLDISLQRAFLNPNLRLTGFWQLFGGTLYDAFILLAWSTMYLGARHQLAHQRERERALRAEALAQATRLESLRAKLSPHFLFNALNAVSTLVLDGHRDDAARAIALIGDVLRSTLRQPEGDDVTVDEELTLVRQYLAIEQIRLGPRLRAEVRENPAASMGLVPFLLLQPLVENAVRHAAAEREQGGQVMVAAERQEGRLRLTVDDDGPGLSDSTGPTGARTRIGMASTRERLDIRFGSDHRFLLERSPLGGLRVLVDLPYKAVGT
jgi:signal transduction histidine kinase